MKITFLGTGTSQGVPMLLSDEEVNFSSDVRDQRLRSSVYISTEDTQLLIDCGPDFRQQILRSGIKIIDAILFTHEHSDHIAGLDDIRPFCYKQGAMKIFGLPRVLKALEKRYDYIFATENRYPGAAQVIPNVVETNDFSVGSIKIMPIRVNHGGLDILGYRMSKFAYLTDVKSLEKSEKHKLKDLEVLVISALRIDTHPTHLNLEEALALVKELQPQRAYFTHISHRLGFHEEVSKQLPDNVFLTYDGLEVLI